MYRRLTTIALAFIFGVAAMSAQRQSGKASFYSRKADGARTANGERLHHDSLTCAHRTLPFGTMLRVFAPATGKEVIVRVNDRGPFVRGRIIDLSWGAAQKLGIIAMGIAQVVVEPVHLTYMPLREMPIEEVPRFEIELDYPELPWHFPLESDGKNN